VRAGRGRAAVRTALLPAVLFPVLLLAACGHAAAPAPASQTVSLAC
jgi:hypothetical protein